MSLRMDLPLLTETYIYGKAHADAPECLRKNRERVYNSNLLKLIAIKCPCNQFHAWGSSFHCVIRHTYSEEKLVAINKLSQTWDIFCEVFFHFPIFTSIASRNTSTSSLSYSMAINTIRSAQSLISVKCITHPAQTSPPKMLNLVMGEILTSGQ